MGTKISALTEATSLDDDDVVPAVDTSGAATVKITVANLRALFDKGVLAIQASATPGTTASVNVDVPADSWTLSDVSSPAGEPATANDPYYLRITDGVNAETLIVIGRSGVTRSLAKSTGSTYLASTPSTVAFAGYVTTPQSNGYMPANDYVRLRNVEPYADRTTAARILSLLAGNTSDIDVNGVRITDLDDPVTNQDAATKVYVDDEITAALSAIDVLVPIVPGTPGATNNPPGNAPDQFFAVPFAGGPIAGEPADADIPYYLHLVNTSTADEEDVLVIYRNGSDRITLGPLTYSYSAGNFTIAFAGFAYLSDFGLASASEYALLVAGRYHAGSVDDAVLRTSYGDSGSGAGAPGLVIHPRGLSSKWNITVQPEEPATNSTPGRSLYFIGGIGTANQNGGLAELDAGPANGGGSTGGTVEIGRNNATDVNIGKSGGGGIVLLEGSVTTASHTPTAAADVATKGYVDAAAPLPIDASSGYDDFDDQPGMGWAVSYGGDGSGVHMPALAVYGYPGEGWLSLAVGEPSDDAALSSRTWQQLDSIQDMEQEFRAVITDGSFAEAHDECTAFMGWISPLGSQMGLRLEHPTTADLILYNGTLYTAAVTLPALAAGEAWRFRLVATPTNLRLFGAVDDGAETLLATISQPPSNHSYARYYAMTGETAATFRVLNLDYIKWSGARIADGSPSGGFPNAVAIWPMDTVVEKALAQPKDNWLSGSDPTSSDDDGQDYSPGSHWINVSTKQAFICLDASSGSAIWHPVASGPVKDVGTGTYTVVDSDDGAVLRFTVPCVVTVPDSTSGTPLRNGHETTMFCTTGVLEFADASAGVSADPLHAASQSRFSSETMAIVAIKVLQGVDTYILTGDLLPSTPDPLTDGDFIANGRMTRTGVGIYSTIFDNLIAVVDPTVADDNTLGYAVGSLFINTVTGATFVCVDASTGAAVWRLSSLSALEYDRVLGNAQYQEVLFRDEFEESTTGRWTGTVSGAGATVAVVVGGTTYASMLRLNMGTTTTGSASLDRALNSFYTNRYSRFDWEVKGRLSALSNGTDEYDAFVCYSGVNGISFTYDRNTSLNWQATQWAAGVPTHTDTGIVADTAMHSFRWVWSSAAGGTVTLYIDGVAVGAPYTGVTFAATTLTPGRAVKSAGTTSPFLYLDFTQGIGTLASPRP